MKCFEIPSLTSDEGSKGSTVMVVKYTAIVNESGNEVQYRCHRFSASLVEMSSMAWSSFTPTMSFVGFLFLFLRTIMLFSRSFILVADCIPARLPRDLPFLFEFLTFLNTIMMVVAKMKVRKNKPGGGMNVRMHHVG